MNNKCINIIKKMNGQVWCKLIKKPITFDYCKLCKHKKYKENEYKKLTAKTEMKKRTPKQQKTERERYSIFTDDLTKCIICGKANISKHEIFYGSKHRQLSIKYGLVIPLCKNEHHNQIDKKGIHFDKTLCDEWHKKGQSMFIKTYPDLDFEDIFKRSYL